VAPPNSIVTIEDANGGRAPELSAVVPSARIISTESSIVVFCLMEQDGDTTITIGPVHEVDPGERPAFDGILETPSWTVVVLTVELETLLRADVSGFQTHVKIWTNRVVEPDEIVIGLESVN
jgi:hypothetical protein